MDKKEKKFKIRLPKKKDGDQQEDLEEKNIRSKDRRKKFSRKATFNNSGVDTTSFFGSLHQNRDSLKKKFLSPAYQIFDG